MIKNREEFADYLRGWGCPNYELDEVIGEYFVRDRDYPIDEEDMDEWLEYMGYLVTEVQWHI